EYRKLSVSSQTELGNLLWRVHRFQEAGEVYRRCQKAHPDDPLALCSLAWFLAVCPDPGFRKPTEAVGLGKQAVQLAPGGGGYWRGLGVASYYSGDWKAAIANEERSMALRRSGDAYDWFLLAMAYWQLGDKEKARTRYDQAVQWMEKHRPD